MNGGFNNFISHCKPQVLSIILIIVFLFETCSFKWNDNIMNSVGLFWLMFQ